MSRLGAAPVQLPPLAQRIEQLETALDALKSEVLQSGVSFRDALTSLEGLELSPADAQAAHEGQLEGFDPALAAAFREASPIVANHATNLTAFFQTYDELARLRMDRRVFNSWSDLIMIRQQLRDRAGGRATRKLTQAFEEVQEQVDEYLKYREVGSGRDGYKRLWALRHMSHAWGEAQEAIRKIRIKLGDDSSPDLGDRLRASYQRYKRIWLNLGTKTSMTSPMVKLLAYLGNPWKTIDEARMSDLLKEMGTRFLHAGQVELTLRGRQNVPVQGKVIFAPSHRSEFVDSMAMVKVLPGRVTPIQTLMFYPEFIRPFINRLLKEEPGLILAQAPGVDVVDLCVQAIHNDRTLLFFPEGNVPSPLGEIRRLRSGLIRISEKLLDEDLSIVPVTIDDPVDPWGKPDFGAGDRELGLQVSITYEKPIRARLVHALSGQHDRLLLDVIRESWHRSLEDWEDDGTRIRSLPVADDAGACLHFSVDASLREAIFDALHGN